MKKVITDALRLHLEGHVAKHRTNVLIMLENPMAIHDHTDYMQAIEDELAQIAEYLDKLEALEEVLAN